MKPTKRSLYRLSIAAVAFLGLIGVGVVMTAQTGPKAGAAWIDDWTHHHMVFSNPSTAADALAQGRLEQWYKIVNDPRYKLQQLKRSMTQRALASAPDFAARTAIVNAANSTADAALRKPPRTKGEPIEKDWSAGLDGADESATITVGTVGSSTVNSSSTLTIGSATLDASAPTAASASGSFSARASSGSSLVIVNGSNTLTLNESGSTNGTCTSGGTPWTTTFARGSSGTSSSWASGIATVLASGSQCSTNIGVNATANSPSDGDLTITANTAGTGANSISLTWSGTSVFTPAWSDTTLGGGTTGTTAGTDGTTSGTTFAFMSSATAYLTSSQLATNIATAVNDNTTLQGSGGVTATTSSNVVTLTSRSTGTTSIGLSDSSFTALTLSGPSLSGGTAATGTVQPNTYPAKYGVSFSGASCSDFVIYPTGKAGGTSSASIVAYNNLYTTGCSGAVPSVYWAYNTLGTITTSPVLSMDGTQVAFIQVSGTTASLVLVKWAAETGESVGSPLTLSNQTSASNYGQCSPTATIPCMYTIAFGNGNNDTYSAPYCDYGSGTIYVGDDSGNLHQFTGVFNGNPAENTTSPWPVNLGSNKLASPVYDPNWIGGETFVGDLGGGLYCVAPTGSKCANSNNSWGVSISGGQIADAPLVDSTANYLLAFVNTSTANTVYGYGEQFFPTTPGTVGVGTGASGYYLYAGALDNVYYQSSTHTGNLYVVGNTGVTTGATLYKVGVSAVLTGTVTTAVTGLTVSATNSYPWPSPVTEFCNGTCASNGTETTSGTDYVFFSVNRGNETGCTTSSAGNGCILSINVSNPSSVVIAGSGLNVTTPGTKGCWATGALIIDNSASSSGASQIYAINLNGNAAGGPTGTTQTSSNCTAGTGPPLNGVQASQSSP
jgi:hypothetical protein